MQIKLTNILNELGINNPNPTAEEVYYYYDNYILNNYYDNNTVDAEKMWKEFAILKQNIFQVTNIGLKKLKLVNQIQLNKFYQGMKDLVSKYNLSLNLEPEDDAEYDAGLDELQINNPNPDEIMQAVNIYFNEYFIKWLETHVTSIDEDLWQHLPKYLDDIKDIMSKDNEFDHDQFDDDMAEEYFNVNMLGDVKKKLWKKYFENVNISKIKKEIYSHIGKKHRHNDVEEGIEWFFRYEYEDIYDDMYAPYVIEPFIEEILDEVISNYEHGEDINELQVTNPNPTAEEVYEYYRNKVGSLDGHRDYKGWREWQNIRSYYEKKYGIDTMCLLNEFEQLSQFDLNKLYREIKQLMKKYAPNNI